MIRINLTKKEIINSIYMQIGFSKKISEVLLEDIPIISIEASHSDWWNKYVDKKGAIVGMNDFGESAPGDDLQRHFGFTTKNILNIINSL